MKLSFAFTLASGLLGALTLTTGVDAADEHKMLRLDGILPLSDEKMKTRQRLGGEKEKNNTEDDDDDAELKKPRRLGKKKKEDSDEDEDTKGDETKVAEEPEKKKNKKKKDDDKDDDDEDADTRAVNRAPSSVGGAWNVEVAQEYATDPNRAGEQCEEPAPGAYQRLFYPPPQSKAQTVIVPMVDICENDCDCPPSYCCFKFAMTDTTSNPANACGVGLHPGCTPPGVRYQGNPFKAGYCLNPTVGPKSGDVSGKALTSVSNADLDEKAVSLAAMNGCSYYTLERMFGTGDAIPTGGGGLGP